MFLSIYAFKHANQIYQLYATLHEWATGEQQVIEFSANAYLDAYNGHVDTLNHIKEKRGAAFHCMMADIYSQAR
jgi:hypothetical protein